MIRMAFRLFVWFLLSSCHDDTVKCVEGGELYHSIIPWPSTSVLCYSLVIRVRCSLMIGERAIVVSWGSEVFSSMLASLSLISFFGIIPLLP